jgi:hypothetical protein
MVFSRLKFVYSRAPERIPKKRDEYTSLVISARRIATSAGTSAQKVL